jgi:hypothetical protein
MSYSLTFHVVPAPPSTMTLVNKRVSGGGGNQNLTLFIQEKAVSGTPSVKGTKQFLNFPIKIGITIKKIIINIWAATIAL